jgi:glycosyltransferase involved in cell wall biosynthesis
VKSLSCVDEIVIVDDGSKDDTPQIVDRLAEPTRVIIHHHNVNQGKGMAVRTAMVIATGDVFVVQDADAEQSPEDIDQLLVPIKERKAKVVMGSRMLGGDRPKNTVYYWGALGLTTTANLLFDAHLTDVCSGYKAFTREIAEKIHFISRGFEFETEFVAKVSLLGEPIHEAAVRYRPRTREEGKKITWKDAFRGLAMLIRCRLGKAEC